MARPKLQPGMIPIAPKIAIKVSKNNYSIYSWGERVKKYGGGKESVRYDWKKERNAPSFRGVVEQLVEMKIDTHEVRTLKRLVKVIEVNLDKVQPEAYYRRLLLENADRIRTILRQEKQIKKLQKENEKLKQERKENERED